MFKKHSLRVEGKFYISVFEIKNKKQRKAFCKEFEKTGKLFIIEDGAVTDKFITLTEPLK